MRIIADAMGGDNAPLEIVKGVLGAASKTDHRYILVGRKSEILRCIGNSAELSGHIEVIDHQSEIVNDPSDPVNGQISAGREQSNPVNGQISAGREQSNPVNDQISAGRKQIDPVKSQIETVTDKPGKIRNRSDIVRNQIEIVNAEQVITMEDEPLSAVQKKKNSSMVVALKLLAAGYGDALVSAGNTGALFAGATLIVKRAPGIRRAAIGTLLPSSRPCLLLDAGANVSVTEEYLEQFALIGAEYMRTVCGIRDPEVGLLNNGTEECKGTVLQIEAGKRLRANKSINFIGNVEASSVMAGVCDVVVCDGFTGNVFLKATEGMGRAILSSLKDLYSEKPETKLSYLPVQKKIQEIKKRFDPSEHGGSPFLGISRPVIKAHGSSNADAFENAIFQAIKYAESRKCYYNGETELS